MRPVVAVQLTLALCGLCACDNAPVAIRINDVTHERALWSAHHLTRYAYVYESIGFFNAFSGHAIRLVVLNDSVASAQDVATDSLLPVASVFPTLDQLFDQAMSTLAAGTLKTITFDPTYNFPSRMDIAGVPDASGSVLASGLELLP